MTRLRVDCLVSICSDSIPSKYPVEIDYSTRYLVACIQWSDFEGPLNSLLCCYAIALLRPRPRISGVHSSVTTCEAVLAER